MAGISQEEVAARLVRALRLDSVMRDEERNVLRAKVAWPSYNYDRGDINAQYENHQWLRQLEADAARRRSWDTRAARSDYLTVMAWVVEMERISGGILTSDEQAAIRELRGRGVPYRLIARKVGRPARVVGAFLGIRRGKGERQGLTMVEFVRHVALEIDWESIAEKDGGKGAKADGAKLRWAGIVAVAADVVNGAVGHLEMRWRGPAVVAEDESEAA